MGKNTANSKAVAAKERKALHEADIQAKKNAELEAKEAAEWAVDAKGPSRRDMDKGIWNL